MADIHDLIGNKSPDDKNLSPTESEKLSELERIAGQKINEGKASSRKKRAKTHDESEQNDGPEDHRKGYYLHKYRKIFRWSKQ